MEGKEEGKGDRKIDRERIDKHPATGPQVFNLHPLRSHTPGEGVIKTLFPTQLPSPIPLLQPQH